MNSPEGSREIFEKRIRELDSWRQGEESAVIHLGELLGISPPDELLEDPRLGVFDLDSLCGNDEVVDVTTGDDLWLATHLIAYVSEYVIKKFDGEWTVDADPVSPTYAQYLVSARRSDGGIVKVNTSEKVMKFLGKPLGRSLLGLISEIEGELNG